MKVESLKDKYVITAFVLKRWKDEAGIKKVIYACLGVMFKLMNTLLSVALTSIIISIIISTNDNMEAFIKILVWVFFFAVSVTLEKFFDASMRFSLFLYRIMETPNMFYKLIKLPFDKVEGPSGKHEFEKAREAVGVGKNLGVEAMMRNFFHLIANSLCLVGLIIISSSLSPWIMMVLLVTGYLRTIKDRKNRQWYKDNIDTRKKIYFELLYLRRKCLDTSIGKDARIYKMEAWFEDKLERISNRRYEMIKTESTMVFIAEVIHFTSGILRDLVCYGYLIYRVSKGMPITEFVLYISVIASFNTWVKSIFDEYARYNKNIIVANNYRMFLDKEEIDSASYEFEIPEADTYSFKFEDVCFHYEEGKNVIDHLNLEIDLCQKLALVGANGAGKTTLVKLMCGLYQPTSGTIYINGIDISKVNQRTLMQKIGVVFQESKVFPETVVRNVSCKTDVEVDLNRVRDCLEKADLLVYIDSLPLKENTILTKNMDTSGQDLSGGQYQKLMLARALYKAAPVLILDEPTAALDPLAEEEMYNRYHEITEGKTSLFISHRLSSTQFCDRVIFIEHGHIKQDGSHDILINEQGPYKRMFEAQAHYYKEEVAI